MELLLKHRGLYCQKNLKKNLKIDVYVCASKRKSFIQESIVAASDDETMKYFLWCLLERKPVKQEFLFKPLRRGHI